MASRREASSQQHPKQANPNTVLEALDMIHNKIDGMSKKAKELLDLAGYT